MRRLEELNFLTNYLGGMNSLFPFPHRKLFSDPGAKLDTYGLDHTYLTLAAAEEAAIANQHDVVYLVGTNSESIAAELAWDKNYTHLVGCGAPVPIAIRARMFNSGDLANLLAISSTGGIFSNFYIFQGGDDAADLGCVTVSGGRCYFDNVHIAGMGHATPGAETGAFSLKLNGAEECAFRGCSIGLDTITRAAANAEILVDGTSKRILFDDCYVYSQSDTAGHLMLKLADTTALDRHIRFKNTLFQNFSVNHATSLTAAFSIPAGCHTHDIVLEGNCLLVGITEWEANDRGMLWIGAPIPVAATSGIAVEPAT